MIQSVVWCSWGGSGRMSQMGPISGQTDSCDAWARLPVAARSIRRCSKVTVVVCAPPTGSVGLLQPAQAPLPRASAGMATRVTSSAARRTTIPRGYYDVDGSRRRARSSVREAACLTRSGDQAPSWAE